MMATMDDVIPIKQNGSKIVYENPWIRVREDATIRPDGSDGIYGVVESNDSVLIAVLNEDNQLLLQNSFSYPAQRWHWEMPGGGKEDDEAVLETSKRELFEETGITARQWTLLGVTRVCDGIMTERMATYLAREIKHGTTPHSDDAGLIRDKKFFDLDQVYEMIQSGDVDEGQTLTSLYLVERYLATTK